MSFKRTGDQSSGAGRGKFPSNPLGDKRSEAQISELGDAIKMIMGFAVIGLGPKNQGKPGKKPTKIEREFARAYGRIEARIESVGKLPGDVQAEVLRAVKIISSIAPEPLEHFSKLTKEMPKEGKLQRMIDSTLKELVLFTAAKLLAQARDFEYLEKYGKSGGDFAFAAAYELSRIPGTVNILSRIAASMRVGEETARMAIYGMVQQGNYGAMVNAVTEARDKKHPLLQFIVDRFAEMVLVEDINIRWDRNDWLTKISEKTTRFPLVEVYGGKMTVKQLLYELRKRADESTPV